MQDLTFNADYIKIQYNNNFLTLNLYNTYEKELFNSLKYSAKYFAVIDRLRVKNEKIQYPKVTEFNIAKDIAPCLVEKCFTFDNEEEIL